MIDLPKRDIIFSSVRLEEKVINYALTSMEQLAAGTTCLCVTVDKTLSAPRLSDARACITQARRARNVYVSDYLVSY